MVEHKSGVVKKIQQTRIFQLSFECITFLCSSICRLWISLQSEVMLAHYTAISAGLFKLKDSSRSFAVK